MLVFLLTIADEETKSKLETINEMFSKAMYNRALYYMNNESDAEDAVQDAFYKLFKNIDKIKDASSRETKSYVISITESCAIDIFRKRKRLKEVSLDESMVLETDMMNYNGDNSLTKEILKLNPKYRIAMSLRYVSNLDYAEIAKRMNITNVYARKLVQRAVKKLEELCREDGFNE